MALTTPQTLEILLPTLYDLLSPMTTTSMTIDQQVHTLLTAQRFGGNFYRKLADAGLAADPTNRARLFSEFHELTRLFGPASNFYSEDLG